MIRNGNFILCYILLPIIDGFLDKKSAKVNSVQEACAKCFSVHTLGFHILQITWKNEAKNIKPFCFIFLYGLQYFKFWYLNRKEFGESFLYWVDFNTGNILRRLTITASLNTATDFKWQHSHTFPHC